MDIINGVNNNVKVIPERPSFGDVPFYDRETATKNRLAVLQLLDDTQTPFTAHNNGLHLKITALQNGKITIIDYWPSTGCTKQNNTYFYCDANHLMTIITKENQ